MALGRPPEGTEPGPTLIVPGSSVPVAVGQRPARWRTWLDWGLILGAIAVSLWLVYTSATALTWFFIGAVIYYLLLPLVNWLDNYMPRWAASLICVALVVGSIVGILVGLLPILNDQLRALIASLPSATQLEENFADALGWFRANVPQEIQTQITNAVERARTQLSTDIQTYVSNIFSFATNLAGQVISFIFFLFGFIIVPFWLFQLWTIRYEGIKLVIRSVTHPYRDDFFNLIRLFDRTFSAYLRGQIILGAVVGVMVMIGLFALRLVGIEIRFILLLGLIAAVTELIPYIGPTIGAIPGLAVALFSTGNPLQNVIAVLAVYLIVQQIENSLLVPKITGDSVNIHPAILTVLLIMFGAVFGILGTILAAPAAGLLRDWFIYARLRLNGNPPRRAYNTLRDLNPPPAATPASSGGWRSWLSRVRSPRQG